MYLIKLSNNQVIGVFETKADAYNWLHHNGYKHSEIIYMVDKKEYLPNILGI